MWLGAVLVNVNVHLRYLYERIGGSLLDLISSLNVVVMKITIYSDGDESVLLKNRCTKRS